MMACIIMMTEVGFLIVLCVKYDARWMVVKNAPDVAASITGDSLTRGISRGRNLVIRH